MSHVYTCDYCDAEIDPSDETVNIEVATLHQDPGWQRHFCCTEHLINWVNEEPNELQPIVRTG